MTDTPRENYHNDCKGMPMNTDTSARLKDAIESRAKQIKDPADREVTVLEDRQAIALSAEYDCSLREVYQVALEHKIWPYRYIRNRDILSRDEQLVLLHSQVAVIGSGGLGGTVILLLARIGIGHLSVVDCDSFDETNLNRQAISTMDNTGDPKAEEARKMVAGINPAVTVRSFCLKIDSTSAPPILSGSNVIVDALDNVPDRLALETVARSLKIPLVHGALAGFDGQVMTVFPEDPGLKLIYGTDIQKGDPGRPEAVMGVPSITPSVVASLQAMEVLKILLHRGQILRQQMLHIDLEAGRFDVFRF